MKIIKNYVDGKIHGHSDYKIKVFDPSKGEPCAEVALSNSKDFEAVINSSIKSQKEWSKTTPLKRAPKPYKDLGDVVTFKLHSKFKPKVWDKNQKEIGEDVAIWKGSTMWINYKASGYNKSIGLGCTLYIQGVQIDNLVQGSAGANGACPFPKREEVTA